MYSFITPCFPEETFTEVKEIIEASRDTYPHAFRASYDNFVYTLAKDGKVILDGLTPVLAHVDHMTVGVVGEAAELLQVFRRGDGQELDYINLLEELGDLEFYTQGYFKHWTCTRSTPVSLEPNALLHTPAWLRKSIGMEAALQIVDAAGEINDTVKRVSIYGNADFDLQRFSEEFNRIDEAMEVIRRVYNIDRELVLAYNRAKLGKRFPKGEYADEDATARADKVGA